MADKKYASGANAKSFKGKVLDRFTQLSLNFQTQEANWIRWAGGRSYLAPLWWSGCITGRLQEASIQNALSDRAADIAKLDAYSFNKVVMWLPITYRNVYLAYAFNKVVKNGVVKNTKPGDITYQCLLLGMTKYKYEQILGMAVKMIKREAGLA